MKYKPLSKSFYQNTRKSFMAEMEPNSLAIFNSNDIYPISADSVMPFEQHRDIFYLSGIDQEESIIILFPDAIDPKHKEIAFVKKTNSHIAVWEGPKLDKEKTYELSGIKTVYWLEDFKDVFQELSTQCNKFYFNTNEHYRQAVETETREDRFIKWCKNHYPAHNVAKSNPILQKLRSIKDDQEIAQIKKACDITERAMRRVISFLKPDVWEYEIEAELVNSFNSMIEAGVDIVLGTDAGAVPNHPFGYTGHRELEIYVRLGMSPMQALVAATSNAAKHLGLNDMGMLSPGYSADFIILDENPLDEIRNTRTISSVYLSGREIDRSALQKKWRP